jgi:protein tyrosine phosphatase
MVVDCSAGCGRNAVLKVNEITFFLPYSKNKK